MSASGERCQAGAPAGTTLAALETDSRRASLAPGYLALTVLSTREGGRLLMGSPAQVDFGLSDADPR